jgi:hypothetical protein
MFTSAELDTFVSAEDAFEFQMEYEAGLMEVVEDSDDFNAPFADPTPATPAEREAHRLYVEHVEQMQELDAYAEQLAEQAAEEWAVEHPDEDPEDYDPEPPAAPAARRPERRSKVDGLTKSERANLYVAARYQVEQVGPIQFRAVNVPTGAEFHVTEVFGRYHRVVSNTGGDHLLYLLECSCQHKQNGAAVCKHEAAAAAVEEFVKGDRPRQDMRRQMEARQEAARREVAEVFAEAA